jgi:hypothetical protein
MVCGAWSKCTFTGQHHSLQPRCMCLAMLPCRAFSLPGRARTMSTQQPGAWGKVEPAQTLTRARITSLCMIAARWRPPCMTQRRPTMDYIGSCDAAQMDGAARGAGVGAGGRLGSVGTGAEAVQGRGCGCRCDTPSGVAGQGPNRSGTGRTYEVYKVPSWYNPRNDLFLLTS